MKYILIALMVISFVFTQENKDGSIIEVYENMERMHKENIEMAQEIGMQIYRLSVTLWAIGEGEYVDIAYIDSLYKNFCTIDIKEKQ